MNPEKITAIQLSSKFIGSMHNTLQERQGKDFRIEYREATEADCRYEKDRVLIGFNFRTYFNLKPGKYTYLMQADDAIMSDTPTEIFTNVEFVSRVHGDILIAGLGLGIMLKMLQEMPEVKTVTVIEKNREVIDLVADQLQLPDNFKIVEADIFHYVPEQKFDVIYFDIYSDLSPIELAFLDSLENQFKPYLKESGWIGSWRQE
jgi:hypothetical protein